MGDISVDLFCEDGAHEAAGRALIGRVADDEGVRCTVATRVAAQGIPRVRRELHVFQLAIRRGLAHTADLLIVLMDANAGSAAERRREVTELIQNDVVPTAVVGCPEPYVERWFLADPGTLKSLFGVTVKPMPSDARDSWKAALRDALVEAGEVVTQGGAEFAYEIFGAMDLERASRDVPSLGAFVSDLRGALRQLQL